MGWCDGWISASDDAVRPQRLGLSLIVLLGVSAIVFFALFLTGDPAALMLPPTASRADIAQYRHAMGFDDPALVQFLRYLGHAVTGNLGQSLRFDRPVLGLIAERLPATALLAVTALVWSTACRFRPSASWRRCVPTGWWICWCGWSR